VTSIIPGRGELAGAGILGRILRSHLEVAAVIQVAHQTGQCDKEQRMAPMITLRALFDRLRSLPIPRSAVLSGRGGGRGIAAVGLLIMTFAGFAVGFRLDGGIADGLIAFALIIAFGFAFEWRSSRPGLWRANG
jgi:hypothetical protein